MVAGWGAREPPGGRALMPRGVWTDQTIAKRSAAAKKAAAARNRAKLQRFVATGEPVMSKAERDKARGSAAHKALIGVQISETIARLKARGTEAVPCEASVIENIQQGVK